ncbi:MAG: MIP/aquaporin family protein [Bacillaceae bacterium]
MEYAWMTKYITEVIATALMIVIGNGAVANVHLKGTKGHNNGWMVIAAGYGFAVMMPAIMFGGISGNHINPAFTIGLAVSGQFPWEHVLPYIVAQFIGAFIGQILVWITFKPFMDQTNDPKEVLGCFSTIPASKSRLNAFLNEFIGSFVLFFGALAITRGPLMEGQGGLAHVSLGFLVWGLVLSLGGPTGPALNPARDLAPRIAHMILPIKGKGSSDWSYAWIPVVAPILAGIAGVAMYVYLYS